MFARGWRHSSAQCRAGSRPARLSRAPPRLTAQRAPASETDPVVRIADAGRSGRLDSTCTNVLPRGVAGKAAGVLCWPTCFHAEHEVPRPAAVERLPGTVPVCRAGPPVHQRCLGQRASPSASSTTGCRISSAKLGEHSSGSSLMIPPPPATMIGRSACASMSRAFSDLGPGSRAVVVTPASGLVGAGVEVVCRPSAANGRSISTGPGRPDAMQVNPSGRPGHLGLLGARSSHPWSAGRRLPVMSSPPGSPPCAVPGHRGPGR